MMKVDDVVLVDTPGFDDTFKPDIEILRMLADWLTETVVLSCLGYSISTGFQTTECQEHLS